MYTVAKPLFVVERADSSNAHGSTQASEMVFSHALIEQCAPWNPRNALGHT